MIFTDSAPWAGSVIESPCSSVYVFVTKVVIFNNGQSIIFFVVLHKIEWVCFVLRILNLEEHQNCMINAKFTTVLTTVFVHD